MWIPAMLRLNRIARSFALLAVLALPASVTAQETPPPRDTSITHMLRLKDGSTLSGRLVSRDSAFVRFETNGGLLTIPASSVIEVAAIQAHEIHGSEYWFPDPNRTRLFFAPTARMLRSSEGYYSNTYLFLQNFAFGASDLLTLGGGFSIVPGNDFLTNNVYYFTPKPGLYVS